MKSRSYFPPEVQPARLRPRTQILLIISSRLLLIALFLLGITVLISLYTKWDFIIVGAGVILLIFSFVYLTLRVLIKAFKKEINP